MEKKTWFWWGLLGLLAIGIIYSSVTGEGSGTGSTPAPVESVSNNVSDSVATSAQESAPQVNTPAPQVSAPQASNSDTQQPPRNSDGTIVQLKITASVGYRNIAFTSQENYTNCSNSLVVITVDGNQQPVFTTYKDIFATSLNLFAEDQHSIAYGSLVDDNGNTLAADLNSGMYGSNTAGNWDLTCDQGQYSLTIDAIE